MRQYIKSKVFDLQNFSNLLLYSNINKNKIFEFIKLLKVYNLGYDLERYGDKKDGGYLLPKLKNIKTYHTVGVGNTIKFEKDLGKNNKLLEIGEKIKDIKKVKAQFMGLFYVPKNKRNMILSFLRKKKFKKKHLTFFINFLIKKKINISIIKHYKHWYEFDNHTDLLNYKTFK